MAETALFKVLMTADTVTGVFDHSLTLARELCGSGGSVALALMGPRPSAEQRKRMQAIPRLRAYESDYSLEWMTDPWRSVDSASEWLLEVADRVGPDVVHLNGYCHAGIAWPCRALVAAHSCLTGWWRAVHGEAPPRAFDEYRARVAAGLRDAQIVVAPSATMLAELHAAYDFSSAARVIPYGADERELAPGPKLDYFLTAGRAWDLAENLDVVERASRELHWPVYIAGLGGRVFANSPNVRALGKVSPKSMHALMQGAAVYLHPAHYEPFGQGPLEAALCGCALVLADIPSLREVWADAALYVAPDDPGALVHAGTMLTRSKGLRHDFARKARTRAVRYTAKRMAAHYAGAYCELVHGQSFQKASPRFTTRFDRLSVN